MNPELQTRLLLTVLCMAVAATVTILGWPTHPEPAPVPVKTLTCDKYGCTECHSLAPGIRECNRDVPTPGTTI